TVAVDGTRMLMLGRDGLVQYNGESVSPYYQDYCAKLFARMNRVTSIPILFAGSTSFFSLLLIA
ncbi:MAG: hypothetical protein II268_00810, partial [Peptococcaceae bacterium]|nr:hypothetical protein [Peptococcaceae bacterium]